MNDPNRLTGWIYACGTDAQKTDSLSKLATARTRANNARASEEAGRTSDAFYYWNQLFNGRFPAYY